jgi:two-component system sensor histidine kinase RegB
VAPTADSRSADITLRALVMARWVWVGLFASVAVLGAIAPTALDALASWVPSRPPAAAYLGIVSTWAAINVATDRWIVRRQRATQTLAGVHLLIDTAVLTALLAISGGATNPFTSLFFVPITLATQVSPRWTWTLALVTLGSFAALFAGTPLPAGGGAHHGHGDHYAGHLQGMWVAFGVSGVLITVFVHRIALSLAAQREELARLRQTALEDRHLTALGTLAAGAAHELGTPLATIQVLVGELPHLHGADHEQGVRDIKAALARCKSIVQAMTSPELRVDALSERMQRWSLRELTDDLRAAAGAVPIALSFAAHAGDDETWQPRHVVAQVLRELVHNAAAAIHAGGRPGQIRVAVTAASSTGPLTIAVHDDGPGMTREVLAAAFDPFFSTKPEGQGLGMGLYLCRAHVRQLGGQLTLDSSPGAGAVARVVLPRGFAGNAAIAGVADPLPRSPSAPAAATTSP